MKTIKNNNSTDWTTSSSNPVSRLLSKTTLWIIKKWILFGIISLRQILGDCTNWPYFQKPSNFSIRLLISTTVGKCYIVLIFSINYLTTAHWFRLFSSTDFFFFLSAKNSLPQPIWSLRWNACLEILEMLLWGLYLWLPKVTINGKARTHSKRYWALWYTRLSSPIYLLSNRIPTHLESFKNLICFYAIFRIFSKIPLY